LATIAGLRAGLKRVERLAGRRLAACGGPHDCTCAVKRIGVLVDAGEAYPEADVPSCRKCGGRLLVLRLETEVVEAGES
jgi:hypothetical protein